MNNVVSRYAMIVQGFSTFVFMQFFSAAVQDLLQCYFLAVECYYSVLLSLYPKVLITCIIHLLLCIEIFEYTRHTDRAKYYWTSMFNEAFLFVSIDK